MDTVILPHSYESWRHCITVDCGIDITAAYLSERISALQDEKDFRTQQFIKLYGDQHRKNVLAWFKQAENSL